VSVASEQRAVPDWAAFGLVLAFAVGAVALGGCSQTPVTQPLRSLERSGAVSFVCVGPDGQGRDINDCPDYAAGANRLLALVTQTLRGEIAVVDLTAGNVVDVDPSTPGFSFLPVGSNPASIVSTPGGVATFVGVAEAGKQGIYALPSSCLGPPHRKSDGGYEQVRDLTSWPACKLPSAPGSMAILVDPPKDDDGNPAMPPREWASCGAPYTDGAGAVGQAVAATRSECAADLALETNPPGRRKLAVALPKLGEIDIIDAQQLLDRPPGSFGACPVERRIHPEVDLPASDIKQPLPPDLQKAGCTQPELNYGPPSQSYLTRPAGFAVSGKKLYVADEGAPVVHVFDVSDPCNASEQPPLLPESFDSPGRVVTTSRVAVSPLTTDNKRFAYAIDEMEGSVMIFDVSPGSADRTPIVRPGSPWLPFEAPDRLAFSSPARDITFALRDVPIPDPETGVAQIGEQCNPDPSIPADSVAAGYRTSSDLTRGASPRKLRGVFGFVMLASGQIAVIDEDDFDARCRRPVGANHSSTPDFRGCAGDPQSIDSYQTGSGSNATPTVSDEASCNVVERHRTRSANFVLEDSTTGVRAPALRSYPRLHTPQGSVPPEGVPPRLLGVDFGPSAPAQVFVGQTYMTRGDAKNPLDIDPATAENDSLVLPFNEPRAYAAKEDFTLTFQGPIMGDRNSGVLALTSPDFTDPGAFFCDRGVEDYDATKAYAKNTLGMSQNLDSFALHHADYVQLESAVPDGSDSYWKTAAAKECGGAANGHYNCVGAFGTPDVPTVARDLTIRAAYTDHLVVEPRGGVTMGTIRCCLPSEQKYTIRGGDQWVLVGSKSGFRHHMTTASDGRCVADCNPRRALLRGRAFEIVTQAQADKCKKKNAPSDCPMLGCVVDSVPVQPDNACVFSSLSARFAVYRGDAPSGRDMSFGWSTTGGFSPLVADLTSQTSSVLPLSMVFVPQIGQLAVADGAAEGLALVSLDSVAVSHLYY